MRKMRVACTGLKFEPKEKLNKLSFKLPEGAEILSAQLEQKDSDNIFWFTYLTPSEAYEDGFKESYPWEEYYFYICECSYTEIEFHEHKYIGNIYFGEKIYAVFYK